MPRPKRPGRNEAEWTRDDVIASENLKALWKQKARDLHLSQNKVAKRWSWSQPAVSYYLNGLLRLNTDAVLQFAVSLEVDPILIDPRLALLMKIRPPKLRHGHHITITTDAYEPRICNGDVILFDPTSDPIPGGLSITCEQPNLIGYYDGHCLIHPITHAKQPLTGCHAHPIQTIQPS